MQISLTLNDTSQTWDIPVNETLLDALRRHGVFGVKRAPDGRMRRVYGAAR